MGTKAKEADQQYQEESLAEIIDRKAEREALRKKNYPFKPGYKWIPGVKCSSGATFGYFKKI